MFLKYFYDKELAHASYLVGCQKTGEAIVIDPSRLVKQYFDIAEQEGFRITGVAETHIHADYVSGARELAERGARLYLSDEGPVEWKYLYAKDYSHQLLKEGDKIHVGKIELQVIHTPGHTPESISFLLTDKGGGADKPMGIFTGDFVFVGSIGRPDLLEEAAGIKNTAEPGARDLYQSIQKFNELPDFVQVWPAHGAGSACGKGLGAIPSSTVGYEKEFNPALQFQDEDDFVTYILSDQPEAPRYFAEMKKVNKLGPKLMSEVVHNDNLELVGDLVANGSQIVDVRPPAEFADSHVKGAMNIPAKMVAGWAGWLVDYSKPLFVLAEPSEHEQVRNSLAKIGADSLQGILDVNDSFVRELFSESFARKEPAELAEAIAESKYTLVDVRSDKEWNAERIDGAVHLFLGNLKQNLSTLPSHRPVVAQCLSGGRSAIAASILDAAGFDVVDMVGGIMNWKQSQLPTESELPLTSAGAQ